MYVRESKGKFMILFIQVKNYISLTTIQYHCCISNSCLIFVYLCDVIYTSDMIVFFVKHNFCTIYLVKIRSKLTQYQLLKLYSGVIV